MRRALGLLLCAVLASGCAGRGPAAAGAEVLIVVSAPLSTSPWIGGFVQNGARLAAAQLTDDGGVSVGKTKRRIRVQVLDNAGSPETDAANARRAVSDGAAAFITDGVGAAAVAAVTDPAQLPVFVTFEGGAGVVDAQRRPTVFRLAPANRPMSVRLADYLAVRRPKVVLLSDDSAYGRDGAEAMRAALRRDEVPLLADVTVPAAASDVAAQVLQARRSGADTLVVWANAAGVATALRAARSTGWDVPVYSGPTGEDPLVRQRLADHREWVDGLTFVSFRITSEIGPQPFEAYRSAYEKRFGADRVGVRQDGKEVVAPPDWSTYSYDAVRLVAASLAKAGGTGAPLLAALQSTTIAGANGDERGFGPTQREGVSPDDMYFGRFSGFVFAPVKDDPLSTGLPPVRQLA